MAKGVPIYKLTQPEAPLRVSAPVVLVRLQEMMEWDPAIRDPKNVEELHNMRIAAKRLRYTLEIFTPTLGPDGRSLLKTVEEIQERLGAIHDADVLFPILAETLEKETEREKKQALRKGGGPPPYLAAEGLVGLMARRRTDRETMYRDFVAFWDSLPPSEFADRLARLVALEEEGGTDDDLPDVTSSPAALAGEDYPA